MGYFVRLEMNLREINEHGQARGLVQDEDVVRYIQDSTTFDGCDIDTLDFPLNIEVKWSWISDEEWLRDLTLKFPTYVVQLNCIGDDEERWVMYAHAGSCYTEDIPLAWPEFDFQKLVTT